MKFKWWELVLISILEVVCWPLFLLPKDNKNLGLALLVFFGGWSFLLLVLASILSLIMITLFAVGKT